MNDSLALMLATLPATLMVAACLPNAWVNPRNRAFRQVVTLIAGAQFLFAAGMALALVTGTVPVVHSVLANFSSESPIALTIHYDGVTSLMLAMVSFVGFVICRYSIRYLDGEETQGRYFRWTALTIGAVSLMVISGNLLMFVAAWVMTSLALHQLLMHYDHRPAAKRAAWTKFTISRIGDAALVAALVIIYSEFKTLDFAELFVMAGSLTSVTAAMNVAAFLLVLGAITKSAQFPFHTWLPQTMETPTPVSALMHAGIVNAGGYLIIRTSPLISLTPWALTTLAIIGGVTACFAAVVMLTQTSVKKSLAYSTIAQMGFMMLQCGLGAFSAAMLHILAHSLYKAHAFLSSGSVMTGRAATLGAKPISHEVTWTKQAVAGGIIVAFLGIAFTSVGINPSVKPGGLLLGGVLCLALTQWVGQVMRTGSRRMLVRAMSAAAVLCFVYVFSFVAVDKIVATSLPASSAPEMAWLVAAIVLAGFGASFALHAALSRPIKPAWLIHLHIHASNGFYIENTFRRVFGPLLSS